MTPEKTERMVIFGAFVLLVILLLVASNNYNNEIANIRTEEIKCKDVYIVPCDYSCPDLICNVDNNISVIVGNETP